MAISSTNIFTIFRDLAGAIRDKLQYPKEVYPLKPTDFANEILNFPQDETGGTYADPAELVEGTISTVTNEATYIKPYTFANCSNLSFASFANCITIGSNAFASCISLSTIYFPEAATINSIAFSNCTQLTSVSFPRAISIPFACFADCSALSHISFPECTRIDTNAFINCTALQEASFPKVSIVGNSAFKNCTALTSIYLPECTSLYSWAFYGTTNLQSVYLPKVEYLERNVFKNNFNCSDLLYLNLPACKSISYQAFEAARFCSVSLPNCEYIDNIPEGNIDIPNTITELYLPKAKYIGAAFRNYSTLRSVNLPEIRRLSGTFDGCSNLETVNISTVEEFGYGGFASTGLSEISIPNAKNLATYTFANCPKLVSVYCTEKLRSFGLSCFENCTSLNTIGYSMPECGLSNIINVTRIESHAFSNCINLQNIVLPQCSLISTKAFEGCKHLSSILIFTASCSGASYSSYYYNNLASFNQYVDPFTNTPFKDSSYLGYFGSIYVPSRALANFLANSLFAKYSERITTLPEEIENYFIFPQEFSTLPETGIPVNKLAAKYIYAEAFYSCSTLTTAQFLEAQVIGSNAFINCSNLISADFPKVSVIYDNCFRNCSNLSSINLPQVTTLGNSCFSNCSALQNIVLPSTLSAIPDGTFYECTNLNISNNNFDNVVKIGSYAFYSCTALENISFPNCTIIERDAFNQCSSLTTTNFSNCSIIGTTAFRCCNGLTTVSFPALQTLGDWAFYSCSNLETFYAPQLETLGAACFNYCPKLTSIICKSTITKVPQACFSSCYNLTQTGIPFNLKNITEISANAFTGTGLSGTIAIPKATVIGYDAFANCSAITKLIFGDLSNTEFIRGIVSNCTNLQELHLLNFSGLIGSYTFYNCPNLKSIYFYGSIPAKIESNYGWTIFNGVTTANLRIYVPQSIVSTYRELWSEHPSIVNCFTGLSDSEINNLKAINYAEED